MCNLCIENVKVVIVCGIFFFNYVCREMKKCEKKWIRLDVLKCVGKILLCYFVIDC